MYGFDRWIFFTVEPIILSMFFSPFFFFPHSLSFAVFEFGFETGVISNYFAVEFLLLRADLLVHTFLIFMCLLYILINN